MVLRGPKKLLFKFHVIGGDSNENQNGIHQLMNFIAIFCIRTRRMQNSKFNPISPILVNMFLTTYLGRKLANLLSGYWRWGQTRSWDEL